MDKCFKENYLHHLKVAGFHMYHVSLLSVTCLRCRECFAFANLCSYYLAMARARSASTAAVRTVKRLLETIALFSFTVF